MGPGDKFFEDSSGQILYVNTPDGKIEVGRQPTPEEADKEFRLTSSVGVIFAALVSGLVWYYFFSDLNSLVYDTKTHLPIPWTDVTNFEKLLAILGAFCISLLLAMFAGLIGAVVVSVYQSWRHVNYKQFWRSLSKANKKQ